MAEERLIRKYANRRLYDAQDSRHVTLDDLRQLLARGVRLKVIDDKSGDDLTRSMLLQIIATQEQFGTPVLSTQLLEAIIRFYGNPIQQLLTSYLEQSIGGLAAPAEEPAAGRDGQGARNTDGPEGRDGTPEHGDVGQDAGLDALSLRAGGRAAVPISPPSPSPASPRSGKRRG